MLFSGALFSGALFLQLEAGSERLRISSMMAMPSVESADTNSFSKYCVKKDLLHGAPRHAAAMSSRFLSKSFLSKSFLGFILCLFSVAISGPQS